jgi:hypothetical protein
MTRYRSWLRKIDRHLIKFGAPKLKGYAPRDMFSAAHLWPLRQDYRSGKAALETATAIARASTIGSDEYLQFWHH